MQTITLLASDLAAANPGRLHEELAAELGVPLRMLVRHNEGQLTEARIERADGQPFTAEEETLIRLTAENHDPGLPSTRQAQQEALDLRRSDARDRLVNIGADAVRVTGLPDLAHVVADIVEALELDL